MKCDYCNKPAVHQITRLTPQGWVTRKMCTEHYQQFGQVGAEMPNPDEDQEMAGAAVEESVSGMDMDAACPECGQTFRAFREASKFGCPECYRHYEDYLPDLFQRIHKADRHVGKAPRGEASRSRLRGEIEELEQLKDDAVANEDFEGAARLRDRIRQLKGNA